MARIYVFSHRLDRANTLASAVVGHTVRVYTRKRHLLRALQRTPDTTPFALILDDQTPRHRRLLERVQMVCAVKALLTTTIFHEPVTDDEDLDYWNQLRSSYEETLGHMAFMVHALPKAGKELALDETISLDLFQGWMITNLPDSSYPFLPSHSAQGPETEPYYNDGLCEYVRCLGGWNAFREVFDWELFINCEVTQATEILLSVLKEFGKDLQRFPDARFLITFSATLDPEATADVIRVAFQRCLDAIPDTAYASTN